MSEVEHLELRVRNLSAEDLARFREWFLEFDETVWDKQIAGDFASGKLDQLMQEAKAEFERGESRDL